jgi:signal transduction histidine kinase
MAKRTPGLRRTLMAVTLGGALIAFAVCVALVGVAAALHGTTTTTATAVQGVHRAEQLQAALRWHGRATEPGARAAIATEIAAAVAEMSAFVTTPRGTAALAEVTRAIASYLAGHADAARREDALAALDALVDANLEKTRAAVASAEAVDRVANAVGVGVAIVLLPLAATLLWWVRARAFQPVFALAKAMARFGHGEREARAVPAGPTELQTMALQFNEMADALETQHAAMLAFLGGVAHDLRTPLSTLALACESLEPELPLQTAPAVRRKLQLVSRQVGRLDRMVSDLLDVTRIEAGRLELRVRVEDARELVRSVGEMFADASPRHHLRIQVPSGEVPVRCDHVRMEQVITNLVSNAIKYSPEGGDIELELQIAGHDAVIRVSDHGIGLSRAERDELFLPFRRAQRARDTAPGVGLGLSVVKRIVDAHAGHIEVDSAPGEGATFRVFVPLSEPVPAFAPV